MSGISWDPYHGRKVVAIVPTSCWRVPDGERVPQQDCVYTIREVEAEDASVFLRLYEIVNKPRIYAGELVPRECMFEACGFRPVDERETDISVFEAMLDRARTPERVR